MAHFVSDDVTERDREHCWGAGHCRDAVAEDVCAPAGKVRLAKHMVRDAPAEIFFSAISRESSMTLR